jgi:hypothetical protein
MEAHVLTLRSQLRKNSVRIITICNNLQLLDG